jgi:hypothetical protein
VFGGCRWVAAAPSTVTDGADKPRLLWNVFKVERLAGKPALPGCSHAIGRKSRPLNRHQLDTRAKPACPVSSSEMRTISLEEQERLAFARMTETSMPLEAQLEEIGAQLDWARGYL